MTNISNIRYIGVMHDADLRKVWIFANGVNSLRLEFYYPSRQWEAHFIFSEHYWSRRPKLVEKLKAKIPPEELADTMIKAVRARR